MDLVREYLLPVAEDEGAFRVEMRKLAQLSLRLVGGLEVAIPLLMIGAGMGVIPVAIQERGGLASNLAIAAIGAATLLVSFTAASLATARFASAASIWLMSACMQWFALIFQPGIPWLEHYLVGNIALVKLGAAVLPLKPLHTLSLGLAVDGFYLLSWLWARDMGRIGDSIGPGQHLFTVIATLACTVLTAVVYRQRAFNYSAHQVALRSAEDLRLAQSKLLITGNAAMMGRLAAALSHELNSPIGVLSSAIDTLAAAAGRDPNAPERIQRVVQETQRAGKDSAARLRSIVARMQRFTNLDRAEVQTVNVNELLTDVAMLHDPEAKRKAEVELNLSLVPRLLGRPQQLSAVFSNLFCNAVDAVDKGGRIEIATAHRDSQIEIRITDNGRGLGSDELAGVFNPAAFRVSGNRITAGNWSLFSCRQIIQAHGGDIEIESQPGKGTAVRITLPHESPTARA